MKPGQFTPVPVKWPSGLYFIQAISTESHHAPSENALYAQAQSQVQDHQLQARATGYVQSMRDKANIRIYLGTDIKGPAGVAATVNGQSIMVSQVRDLALRVAGASITDKMILDRLIDREAQRQDITVSSSEIDASLEETRSQIRPKRLEELLQVRHMRLAQLRDDLRVKIEADKLVIKAVGPSKTSHVGAIPSATWLSAGAEKRAEFSRVAMFEHGYIVALRARSHAINYLSQ